MAKTYVNAVKYMIHIKFEVKGIVDKPDIVGAIFGQSEGLLGDEMDLKELQKNGKVGRIEIEHKSALGKTKGTIYVPSSMDMVETSILAAAVESVDKVGPCEAKFDVGQIEDTRTNKREEIKTRAKALLKRLMDTQAPETDGIRVEVQEDARAADIELYGADKLPCGPDVKTDPEIIVVEGRADVVNMLKNNIKNVIGMEGSKISEDIVALCKEKQVTVFVDGDRGGDLIARKLIQLSKVDFVAKAPDAKEVEELQRKEIIMALRKRMTVPEFEQALESGHGFGHATDEMRSRAEGSGASSEEGPRIRPEGPSGGPYGPGRRDQEGRREPRGPGYGRDEGRGRGFGDEGRGRGGFGRPEGPSGGFGRGRPEGHGGDRGSSYGGGRDRRFGDRPEGHSTPYGQGNRPPEGRRGPYGPSENRGPTEFGNRPEGRSSAYTPSGRDHASEGNRPEGGGYPRPSRRPEGAGFGGEENRRNEDSVGRERPCAEGTGFGPRERPEGGGFRSERSEGVPQRDFRSDRSEGFGRRESPEGGFGRPEEGRGRGGRFERGDRPRGPGGPRGFGGPSRDRGRPQGGPGAFGRERSFEGAPPSSEGKPFAAFDPTGFGGDEMKSEPIVHASAEEKAMYLPILEELRGTLKAKLLDEHQTVLHEVDVKDLVQAIANSGAKAVVFDGIITKRLAEEADKNNVGILVGVRKGKIGEGLKVKALAL